MPGATVILFGSRATGLARPESDYDLLVILPDDIDPYVRALIMSNVRNMVRETGAAVDHEYVTVNTWQNPPPGARILVEQAKSQGEASDRFSTVCPLAAASMLRSRPPSPAD